jgi:hypothetical protein
VVPEGTRPFVPLTGITVKPTPLHTVEVIAVIAGVGLIVTEVVTGTDAQPPEAGMVYVTVYVPTVLVLGVMAPVPELIVNPSVEL